MEAAEAAAEMMAFAGILAIWCKYLISPTPILSTWSSNTGVPQFLLTLLEARTSDESLRS